MNFWRVMTFEIVCSWNFPSIERLFQSPFSVLGNGFLLLRWVRLIDQNEKEKQRPRDKYLLGWCTTTAEGTRQGLLKDAFYYVQEVIIFQHILSSLPGDGNRFFFLISARTCNFLGIIKTELY